MFKEDLELREKEGWKMSEDKLISAKRYLESHDEEVYVSYMKHLRWLISEVERLRKFEWMYEASKDDQATVIAELTKERDIYKSGYIEITYGFAKRIEKLEAENEELKKRLGEIK